MVEIEKESLRQTPAHDFSEWQDLKLVGAENRECGRRGELGRCRGWRKGRRLLTLDDES